MQAAPSTDSVVRLRALLVGSSAGAQPVQISDGAAVIWAMEVSFLTPPQAAFAHRGTL
jgi:hypothetical protein